MDIEERIEMAKREVQSWESSSKMIKQELAVSEMRRMKAKRKLRQLEMESKGQGDV